MDKSKEFLRYGDLKAMGYGSQTTIWRAVKKGVFPQPYDDGRGRPAWLRKDIEDWQASLQHIQGVET